MAKILAIDDNNDNLISLRAILNEAFPDSEVFTALNGAKGIELAIANDPDVILLDINMPGMNGFEVCRHLKNDEQVRDIPVVFLTASRGDKESRIQALDNGAEAFLAKPIDETELTAQIRAMVKIKSANEQKRNEKDRLSKLVIERTLELEKGQIATLKLLEDLRAESKAHEKTEKALRESEDSYRNMFENNPQPMWLYDVETLAFVQVNNAAIEHYGYSKEEFLSMSLKDIRPSMDVDKLLLHVEKTNPKYNLSGHWRHLKKNGELIHVEIVSHAITFNNRPARHVLIKDITERWKAEKALLLSEEKFRSIFENHSAVKLLIDPNNGDIVDANIAAAKYYGWSCNELKQMKIQQLNTLPAEKVSDKMQQIKDQTQTHFEFKHQLKDGSLKDVEVFSSKIEIGGKDYLHSIIHDVSDRKRAEDGLQKLNLAINQSKEIIFITDKEGTITFINPQFTTIYGYSAQDVLGKETPRILKSGLIGREKYENFWKALLRNKSIKAEYKNKCKDGNLIDIEGSADPILDKNGEITGFLGIQRDITQRKRDEAELKESFSLVTATLESTDDAILVVDKNRKVTNYNKKFIEFWKLPESILKTQSDEKMISFVLRQLKDPDSFQKKVNELYLKEDETSFDIIELKDGRTFERYSQSQRIEGKNVGRVWSFRDITIRQQAEKEVITLSKAIEQGPSSIIVTNAQGKIEFVNNKYTSLTQYQLDEVRGKYPRIFNPGRLSESEIEALWETLQKGNIWKSEVLSLKKDKSSFWEEISISAVMNPDGKISNFILILDDITEKKQMLDDLISAKEKAEESDRLKSAFLANMSHEIRTPLNSIIGFSDLLLDPDFDPDKHYEFARTINTCGNNLLLIISNIMDISKIEAGQLQIRKTMFSVNKLMIDLQKEYIGKAIEKGIVLIFNSMNPNENIGVKSDENKLHQILTNFLDNAIKFTEKGFVEFGFKRSADFIQFYVKDSGIGIAKEFHETIFERFRQVEPANKRKYGGNGLGLAISKSLIELLGGTVWIESELHKGSIFYFTIPI